MDDVATPPPSRNVLGFMVPSPKETPGLDPYAFPAEDIAPSPRTLSTKPIQLSVHPRTVLPPGNPLPQSGSHHQRAAEFFLQQQQQQQQFPASLHSPVHGSQPSLPEQQFTHPSSRLENDSVVRGQMDQVMKQAYQQSQLLVSGIEVSTNSGLTPDAIFTVEKAKKKKKPKKNVGEEKEKGMLQQVNVGSFPPMPATVMEKNHSVGVGTGNISRVDYKTQTDVMTETTGFGMKSPASVLSGSGDSNSLPPGHGLGSHSIPCFPTTTSATTFTNSLPIVPQNRRLSTDSVELPISRPASRTSTVSASSGSSEGKSKETAESVSMSKILEIIEREKMLGSSNPCKRRRTAKPQHIQEAEEEAKRFAAANTTHGGMKDAASSDSVPANQPSSKKHLLTDSISQTKSIPAGLLQGKGDSSSRTSSQMSSPNLPCLDTSPRSNSSSIDHLEKTQTRLPTHVVDEPDSNHVHPGFNQTVVYSESNSYKDTNQKQQTPTQTVNIRTTSSQSFSSTVSTESPVADLNSDDKKHSVTVNSSQTLMDAVSKQLVGSSVTEKLLVEQGDQTFTQQEISTHQSIQNHQPSIMHHHPMLHQPTKSKGTNVNEMPENTKNGKLCNSQDPSVADSIHHHLASTVFSAPNHGQHVKMVSDVRTVSQQSPSSFPSSAPAVEHRHNLSSLQNSMQNIVHHSSSSSSSSPSPQWEPGSHRQTVPSPGPTLSTPNTLLDNQGQDLKSSLTSDYHGSIGTPHVYRTQSETADMISGNDFSLAKQPLLSSTLVSTSRTSVVKCPPSQATPQIPVDSSVSGDLLLPGTASFSSQTPAQNYLLVQTASSQTPPVSVSALSGGVTPVGTLPSFGAFAGMKMDMVYHSSMGPVSDGSLPRSLNSVSGVDPVAHKSALPNQSLTIENAYSDNSFMKDKPQNPVANHNSIKNAHSVNMGILTQPVNNYQQIKQEANVQVGCQFPNNGIGANVRPSQDMDNTAPYPPELQYQFQASDKNAIHQGTVAHNPLINLRQGSTLKSTKHPSPSEETARLDLKPAMGNHTGSSLNMPVMPSNLTPEQQLLHNNYMAHEKAAHGSIMISDKANGSQAKQVNSFGTARPLIQINLKTPVTGLQQGNGVKCGSAPPRMNNTNSLNGTPPVYNKTPGWDLSEGDTNKQLLRGSYKNGKWPPQDQSVGGGIWVPEEKTPKTINGWNARSPLESRALKRENGVYGKPLLKSRRVGIKADRFGKTHAPSVAKKTKAGNGMVKNGSLPGLKKVLPSLGARVARAPPSVKPKLEPSFAHMSPEEELHDRLRNNRIESVPNCNCLGPNYQFNESMEGPFYSQLGVAKDMATLRRMMEERSGLSGKAIRLEKVHYTGKEGRTQEGCPIAKWIIRRSGPEEKYLCVARKRPGHFCDAAYIVIVIVAWEGVASSQADSLYSYLVSALTKYGFETDRRCGSNDSKTCACQGVDLIRRGASFSFGCSWSMYFNRCKYARSNVVRKFKLKNANEEEKIEEHLQDLATKVAPLYKIVAPDAYRNQIFFEETAGMCRLGNEKGRPFSGVTACVDFCAHSHKDLHNMQNGSTVVVTLTKHRGLSKANDEQLHVLPLYVMDTTDEHGSIDGQMQKVQAGALEILEKYSQQARLRAAPAKKCRRGMKKNSPVKANMGVNTTTPDSGAKGGGSTPATPVTPGTPTMDSDTSFSHSQDSNQSLSDSSLSGNNSSAMQTPDQKPDISHSRFVDKENPSNSGDATSQNFKPSEMYEKVWEYFYNHGVFPPTSQMNIWAAAQKQAMMNAGLDPSHPGANSHGSIPPHSPHQPPSHQHPFQAANGQQNLPSPNVQQHPFPSGHPPSLPGHIHEAASPADLDQEIIHLTNADSRSGSVRSPHGHLPSRPQSVNEAEVGHPNNRRPSSVDLHCSTALESGRVGHMSPSLPPHPHPFSSTPVNAHSRPASRSSMPPSSPDMMNPNIARPHSNPGVPSERFGSPLMSPKPNCDGTSTPLSCNDNQNCSTQSKPVMQSDGSFVAPTLGQGPDEPTFTMIDPTVVRCEWKDNRENFHDPGIGGVAIALSHGAVLFEVAKRELHATTALKNPNRYQPTRVSLVFYQHKNLNYFHHGYYEYERKLAAKREERIKKLMEEGQTAEEAEKAVKPTRKRKKKLEGAEEEEEKVDFAKTSAAKYKYMWDTTVRHGVSLTTDSIITRWIDPQPMVTGPYQRWV